MKITRIDIEGPNGTAYYRDFAPNGKLTSASSHGFDAVATLVEQFA